MDYLSEEIHEQSCVNQGTAAPQDPYQCATVPKTKRCRFSFLVVCVCPTPDPNDTATTHIQLLVAGARDASWIEAYMDGSCVDSPWAGNLDGELPWNSGFFLMLPRRHGLHGISVPAELDFDIFGFANVQCNILFLTFIYFYKVI